MASIIAPLIPWSFAITFVSLTAALWSGKINAIVTEPYLDEVFHIGQAQAYLRGRWDIWDPKLTTPPGLYLVSWALIKSHLASDVRCALTAISTDVSALRSTNWSGSILLAWTVRSLLLLDVEGNVGENEGKHESDVQLKRYSDWAKWELIHTTINVYLFPPLFFFYGLYYTDVLSALSVLYAYRCYLARQHVRVMFAGLLSLLFRQTNIFWVSVFLGGLEFCRMIPKGRPEIEFPSHPTFYDIVKGSWQHASAYDPLISQACFEDYIKTGISYAVAGLTNLSTLVWSLSPYLVILSAFAEFVFWNGGVVLGDKENHVASIHLTQMIYIWPYFAFFSWPLLYCQCFPETIRPFSYPARYPRKAIICITMAAMSVVVRYNTIVHPFTLADNRHYMFYIFRILLRHRLIKYLAVPIYFGCAWVTLAALGGVPTIRQVGQGPGSWKRKIPGEEPFPPSPQQYLSPMKRSKSQESTLPSSPSSASIPRRTKIPQQNDIPPPPSTKQKKPDSGRRASFILIWLLATALSVITTPLVEPRYLIVPWLIWRLHMAVPRPEEDSAPTRTPNTIGEKVFVALIAILYERHDHRLWLETIWFSIINLATGYIFLYWGFAWPQEPGKVQRFMW